MAASSVVTSVWSEGEYEGLLLMLGPFVLGFWFNDGMKIACTLSDNSLHLFNGKNLSIIILYHVAATFDVLD